VGVKPLAGGSSHLQGVTRDRPIISFLQKTCVSESIKDTMRAFSAWFSSYKYPEGFKPIGITTYDGKQAPQQWLRCYSTAIEVAGSSNITKVVYFPMALDPAPLTWLESLSNNSIDSRERLKKVFIDNFQERSLAQVLITILLNINRNATSSYSPIHVVSSTSVLLLRISRRKTSSTASTTASPTQESTETLAGTDQKLLQGFVI
jgi:hypothetical protein